MTLKQCDVFFNLLFFEDSDYIAKIFSGINTDINLHKAFKKYLSIYTEEIVNEWIDDAQREKHLEVIKKIMKNDGLEYEKAILLYFLIWNQKDKFEELEKKEITGEMKEQAMGEILAETIPELILDSIPYSRTIYKTYKLLKY